MAVGRRDRRRIHPRQRRLADRAARHRTRAHRARRRAARGRHAARVDRAVGPSGRFAVRGLGDPRVARPRRRDPFPVGRRDRELGRAPRRLHRMERGQRLRRAAPRARAAAHRRVSRRTAVGSAQRPAGRRDRVVPPPT